MQLCLDVDSLQIDPELIKNFFKAEKIIFLLSFCKRFKEIILHFINTKFWHKYACCTLHCTNLDFQLKVKFAI